MEFPRKEDGFMKLFQNPYLKIVSNIKARKSTKAKGNQNFLCLKKASIRIESI